MVEIVSKPRKKKCRVEVTHAVFGAGKVIERRPTENGSDVLVVHFPDGETRTLLTAGRYWVDSDLTAIPVSTARKTKDKHKDVSEVELSQVAAEVAAD
jgi:hypothetical protein